MDEVTGQEASRLKRFARSLKSLAWTEPEAFDTKGRLNTKFILNVSAVLVVTFIMIMLLLPSSDSDDRQTFSTRSQPATAQGHHDQTSFRDSFADGSDSMSRNTNSFGGTSSPHNHNTTMIIGREGDARSQIMPGTKLNILLPDSLTITSHAIPVMALIKSVENQDGGDAVCTGAKIFGEASFDSESERAVITWKTIMLADGRSKPFAAIALGPDGQPGIPGDVHTDSAKNISGSMLTRFAAGVAEGAVSRNPFGQSQGGLSNGLLSGASEVAKERADLLAENLKKPRAWIEIPKGVITQAILIEPFTFREPGGAR